MFLDFFSKPQIPEVLPDELQKIISELQKSEDSMKCLRSAYSILVKKYRGYRFKTYIKIYYVFKNDIDTLWNKNGFLPCTNLNFLMRTLLLKSNFFIEDDIRLKWTQIWYISPHQYLQVKVNDKWISIDLWGHAFGIKFGDTAHGFH